MGDRAFSYQAPLCGTSCQFGFRNLTPSLTLRLGLKLSFLIKLIVRDGSGDQYTSLDYAPVDLDCWGTSRDALSIYTQAALFTLHVHVIFVVIELHFFLSAGIPGLVLFTNKCAKRLKRLL